MSTDEQDQQFAGRRKGTTRCKYKKEGDEYFMDSIYKSGFIISFYPCNQPTPKKYCSKGYSLLHSRIFFVCDQLELNSFYRLFIGTLFALIKFCVAAINTNPKVLTLGVAQNKNRGIPPLVYQVEERNPSRKKDAVRALKGTILKDDNNASNLLAL